MVTSMVKSLEQPTSLEQVAGLGSNGLRKTLNSYTPDMLTLAKKKKKGIKSVCDSAVEHGKNL